MQCMSLPDRDNAQENGGKPEYNASDAFERHFWGNPRDEYDRAQLNGIARSNVSTTLSAMRCFRLVMRMLWEFNNGEKGEWTQATLRTGKQP
jgi:hypothetical protein